MRWVTLTFANCSVTSRTTTIQRGQDICSVASQSSLNRQHFKKDLKGHRGGEGKKGDEGGAENEIRRKQLLSYQYTLTGEGYKEKYQFSMCVTKITLLYSQKWVYRCVRGLNTRSYSSHGVFWTAELLKCCGFWSSSKAIVSIPVPCRVSDVFTFSAHHKIMSGLIRFTSQPRNRFSLRGKRATLLAEHLNVFEEKQLVSD